MANPFCPNCGGFTSVNRDRTSWKCKRSCGAGGVLDPHYKSSSQIEAQMKSQYPNPELKYPENAK